MKFTGIILILPLVAALNAGQSPLEKYTEVQNFSNKVKIEAERNKALNNRDDHYKIRDYREVIRNNRLQALYSRIENTPYR